MRILIVVHGFPPTALGGTELYAHDLGCVLQGHFNDEVFVLTRESDPKRREYAARHEEISGLRVVRVNNTYGSCVTYEDTYSSEKLRRVEAGIIDEIRPDLVHIHHISGHSIGLVDETEARGIPAIFLLNDYWLICHRGQLLDCDYERCDGPYRTGCGECLEIDMPLWRDRFSMMIAKLPPIPGRGILRRAVTAAAGDRRDAKLAAEASATRLRDMQEMSRKVTHFQAPSNTLRQRFLEFGVDPDRIAFHEQGINQARFQGIERTKSDKLRVGFLGSLLVSKAPHVFIEAFDGIPESAASLHMYGGYGDYHGDDSYRKTIGPLLARPYVDHPGSIPHAEIPKTLASIDVLVIPSIWIENAPFVIREAYVSGIPVLASNIGGMAEMVKHEKSGLCFEAGSADGLRRAILRLVEEPGLLDRLRAGIPRMLTMEEDAENTRRLYQRFMNP